MSNYILKKNSLLIIIFTLLLGCSSENADNSTKDSPSKQNLYSTGVIKTNNTAIRLQPMLYTSRISTLKKGTKVQICESSGEKDYIAKTWDYWFKIKTEDGIEGWTFGKNLKRFYNNDSSSILAFTNKLNKEESEKILKDLKGKWWSINKWGHYTNFGISIFPDGKYISFKKDKSKQINGKISIDANNNSITFEESTYLGKKYNFFELGGEYFIEIKKKNYSIKFKRIALEPELEKNEK